MYPQTPRWTVIARRSPVLPANNEREEEEELELRTAEPKQQQDVHQLHIHLRGNVNKKNLLCLLVSAFCKQSNLRKGISHNIYVSFFGFLSLHGSTNNFYCIAITWLEGLSFFSQSSNKCSKACKNEIFSPSWCNSNLCPCDLWGLNFIYCLICSATAEHKRRIIFLKI